MTALATVIIPTYNRAGLVLRALDSVRDQIYPTVELIVIDDGSTDNTRELISEWILKNSMQSFSVNYIYKNNGGPSSCRNIGISQAKGDYIYFLDSDDYMHSDLLEEAIKVLQSEESDCVIFGFNCENISGRISQYLPPKQDAIESYLKGQLWGYTSSSLKRKVLIDKIGLWCENICIAEDYEYLGRALLNSQKTSVLRSQLLTVTQGNYSLGSKKDSGMGLDHRLKAEALVVRNLKSKKIPIKYLSAYSSRLFKTAIHLYAKGEVKFAKELGQLALNVEYEEWSLLNRCKRLVWQQGRWMCIVWSTLTRCYSIIRNILLLGNKLIND